MEARNLHRDNEFLLDELPLRVSWDGYFLSVTGLCVLRAGGRNSWKFGNLPVSRPRVTGGAQEAKVILVLTQDGT